MNKETYYTLNILLLVGCFWCIIWAFYKLLIEPTNNFMNTQVVPIPNWLSCGVPFPITSSGKPCTDTKLNGWSLGHIAIYLSLGLLLPHLWMLVLLFSVLFEAFEYIVNWEGKWLLDPLVNMVGYALGHIAYIDLHKWLWLSTFNPTIITICSVIIGLSVALILIYRT